MELITNKEKNLVSDILRKIQPTGCTSVRIRVNKKCMYMNLDRIILSVLFELKEINGEIVLVISYIKTGLEHRGSGACKKFLNDLVNICPYKIMLADIISDKMYNMMKKYYDYEKIDYTMGKDEIVTGAEMYSDYFGSYIIHKKEL